MLTKSYFLRVIIMYALLHWAGCFLPGGLTQVIAPDDAGGDGLKIWLAHPAEEWENALPVGNGRLGAMIFGGIENERIQLNEESVWAGRKLDYHNPQSLEGLKEVRRLLFEGRFVEAEKTAQAK